MQRSLAHFIITSYRLALLVLLVFTTSCVSQPEEEKFIIGNLEHGKYQVGFRSSWQLDQIRDYELILDDSVIVPSQKRPILLNIWYPTVDQITDRMTYGEYFDIQTEEDDFALFSKTLRDYNIDILANELLGENTEDLDSTGRKALDFLLQSKTQAHRNTPFPQEKKLPLVIYHSGARSSYDDNSVLCEFLASHGYVVIGSAFQKAGGSTLSVDSENGSFDDIQFLLDHASQLGFVDDSQVTLIGHSLGAQTLLLYQSKGLSKASSLVLIDATFEQHSINNDLFWSEVINLSKENTDQFNNQLLAISRYDAFYQLYETFEQADKHYLSIDGLTHNEFISQGVKRKWLIEKFGLDSIPQDKAFSAVSERYSYLCNTILQVISGKAPKEVRSETDRWSFETNLGTANSTWRYTGQASPPTPRQHFAYSQELGTDEALEILKLYEAQADSSPLFSPDYAFGWVFELLSKDNLKDARKVNTYYNRFTEDGVKKVFEGYIKLGKRFQSDLIINYFQDKLTLIEN